MSALMEKMLEKVNALPPDAQDAIAYQVLDLVADEERWQKAFAEKRDIIRRMAEEALEEHARGETIRLPDHC